jgi:branched chain amino acid efflux pump
VIEASALNVLALVMMGVTTLLLRSGGFWLMRHVPLTPRRRRMLEALPGSMVIAIALPIAFNNGPAAFLAIAAAAAVMGLRDNAFLAVVAGMLVAAATRLAGI